ncbi:MAG: hypothetical protein MUF04_06265, partial [Akkermansiaceae bacterium]|nr:hypothetical protein [Akkermansiaceae bacterium]
MKQHNQPPPRDIIAAFRTDPAYQPLIEAFDAFRKTGSIDGLRGVFFPNNYELNKLGTSVADYFPWDDESSAIVDFAIHAFGLNYQPAPNHGSLSNWVWS